MVKDNKKNVVLKETSVDGLRIPQNAKIKVFWDDVPENYSKDNKIFIRNHFADKYGVTKTNINVIYRPIKKSASGDIIEISGAGVENIMDTGYQRELFKRWLSRESKTVDFDRLCKLDDKVNSELNLDSSDSSHKKWSLKWIFLNGFLCFGGENFVSLSNLDGLTIVNSYPENAGGKSTFSIDAFKFLLYGKTTKSDKNEQIFNQYWDNDELMVRGMLDLEGKEILIERLLTRSKKRDGGWNVTNKVNFYELAPDGEEIMLTDADSKSTTEEIRKAIGSEKDFELVTLATMRNLDDLIGLSVTESSKLLTRFIGLEVIELKSEVVRKQYNAFAKTKKSNHYDLVTLNNDINGYDITLENGTIKHVLGHKENIIESESLIKSLTTDADLNIELINKYNNDKDNLLSSKKQIDVSILTLNPSKLNEEIAKITNKGISLKNRIDELVVTIEPLKLIIFDEDKYHSLKKREGVITTEMAVKEAEVSRLNNTIKDLINGGICQACNRQLDDVDNSEHIKEHESSRDMLLESIDRLRGELITIVDDLSALDVVKVSIDNKDRLEVEKDRVELDLENLRLKLKSKKVDINNYKNNIDSIEFNKDIDIEVDNIKTKLTVCGHKKNELMMKIEQCKSSITNNSQSISDKELIMDQITKESEIDKLFKVYIEMVGKKGISKLVLRSVLPIINSELQRLLDGVVDFEVEIFINDKNDIQFMLIKDDVEKHLKSGSGLETTAASIALRCVLGKVSCLPMPNFITFDEVLGKVANVNIPLMKPLFDKISDLYDTVFFITHNEIVKDWATQIITIKKEKNISSIYVV
jgi:hypothetical protein